jgi:alpha-beta hydrolase superfamily lysophospholipase
MLNIWTVFFVVFLSACSSGSSKATDSPQAADKKKTTSFPTINNLNFKQYQSAITQYLHTHSLAARTDKEIELNLPFDIPANKNVAFKGRFLLFHGLNDSPFVWLDFAKQMTQRGFDVRAILLAGHGSHPRKMLDVTAKQWRDSAQAHYQLWASEKDAPLFLGGFSMGAILATSLAIDNPDVKGLLLVSPAYHSSMNNLLRFSWLYSKFKTWLFGQMLIEDNPTKYNSIAINSANAYYNLSQYLKSKWTKSQRLDIPVLMLLTKNDSVVDVQYSRDIFQKRFIHKNKKLLLYTTNKQELTQENEELRYSYYPKTRILNQSHLSLINNSTNPLLGKDNKVLICNGNEYPIFMACMKAKKHWYGAQNTPSPDGVSVARSTYNPDFDTLVQRFEDIFINNRP